LEATVTADPRDTARQWLADTMCADLDIDLDKPSCRRCLEKADAIVNHPGVEVEETGIVVDWDSHPVRERKRLLVKLPWGDPQPAEEGTGT
jgi:hypothetical protein